MSAFDLLKKGMQKVQEYKKLEKSEFVEEEAEESDEEHMFGFGGAREDEEEDGEDQDRELEDLVDDRAVDVREKLVLEKVR